MARRNAAPLCQDGDPQSGPVTNSLWFASVTLQPNQLDQRITPLATRESRPASPSQYAAKVCRCPSALRGRVGLGAWALVLAQAFIDAVFVRVHAGDEPAGLQAIGKPREARPRHLGSARPKARIPVAPKRARQNVTRSEEH